MHMYVYIEINIYTHTPTEFYRRLQLVFLYLPADWIRKWVRAGMESYA